MFGKTPSSASASSPRPTLSSSASILDSTNPKSPLFTLDYVVPVHSLDESVQILRRAHGRSSSAPAPAPSAAPPNRAAILAQLNQQKFDVHHPSFNRDLSHLVDPVSANARVQSPEGYEIPVHNLSHSIGILQRFSRKSSKSRSTSQ